MSAVDALEACQNMFWASFSEVHDQEFPLFYHQKSPLLTFSSNEGNNDDTQSENLKHAAVLIHAFPSAWPHDQEQNDFALIKRKSPAPVLYLCCGLITGLLVRKTHLFYLCVHKHNKKMFFFLN